MDRATAANSSIRCELPPLSYYPREEYGGSCSDQPDDRNVDSGPLEADGRSYRGHLAVLHQGVYIRKGSETEKGFCYTSGFLDRSDESESRPLCLPSTFRSRSLQLLEEKPSFTFWTTLATCFDAQARSVTKGDFTSICFHQYRPNRPVCSQQLHLADLFSKLPEVTAALP